MPFSFKQFNENANAWVGRHYYACVSVVCLAVLIIGWFVVLQKQYTTIQDAGLVDLSTANAELQKRKTYMRELGRMQESFDALNSEQLTQVAAVLPSGIDEIDIMNTMQSFATSAHATILSIDVTLAGNAQDIARQAAKSKSDKNAALAAQPLVTNTSVNIAYIVMNIQPQDASYAGFKLFLSALDRFAPIVNLRQMSYSPTTTSYALQLETYYTD